MSKLSHEQVSFNTGEISAWARGRTDLDRYRAGVETMTNFIPLLEGPIEKRPGTQFIANTEKDGKAALFAFEYSIDESYVIEFTERVMRIYRDRALVFGNDHGLDTYNTFTITNVTDGNPVRVDIDTTSFSFISPEPTLAAGDTLFIDRSAQPELNGRYFQVDTFAAGFVHLKGEDGTGRATGAHLPGSIDLGVLDRVLEIETPYLEADLHNIQTGQIADEIFVVCPGYRVAKIVRFDLNEEAEDWLYMPQRFAFEILPRTHVDLTSGAIDTTNPVEITIPAGHGLTTGDIIYIHFSDMPELNDRFFEITQDGGSPTTIFSLDGEDGTGRTLVPDARFSGHYWLTQAPIVRRHAPPFNDVTHHGTDGATLHYIAAPTPKFVCSEAFFGPEHNGLCVKIYENETSWGWAAIASHITTNVTEVNVIVGNTIPAGVTGAGNATRLWWMEAEGFNTVAFYEDRLWFAGTVEQPQTVWGSRTAEYENFITYSYPLPSGPAAQTDVDAQAFTINAKQLNAIVWMAGGDPLVVGTTQAEYTVKGANPQAAISSTNIAVASRTSSFGSTNVAPVLADTVILFAQRSKKKIREYRFKFEEDTYVAENLLRLARHIAKAGIVQMSFQDEPTRLLWIVTGDGSLASFVYERAEEVKGWSRHLIGGTSVEVESVCVIPSSTEDENEVWLSVKRTVGGVVKRHVEVVTSTWEVVDDNEKPWFLDSAIRYDGVPATTMYGANHLAGETIQVVADGRVHPDKLVAADGTFTLDYAASVVTYGLGYVSKMKTVDIEIVSNLGTTQGKKKKIFSAVLQLLQTGAGLFYGGVEGELEEFNTESFEEIYDVAGTLFDGQTDKLEVEDDFTRQAQLIIEHRLPLPCTLISAQMELEIRGGEK